MIRTLTNWYIFFIAFSVVVIALNWLGYLTFGFGINDHDILILLLIKLALITIFYLLAKKNCTTRSRYLFFGAILITVAFVMLKISIFRGSRYPWNGKIFVVMNTTNNVQDSTGFNEHM